MLSENCQYSCVGNSDVPGRFDGPQITDSPHRPRPSFHVNFYLEECKLVLYWELTSERGHMKRC